MFNGLLADGNYSTFHEMVEHFGNRCQGIVDAGETPYYQLQAWVDRPKRTQAKLLLMFKQGLVCNRCDRIMPSENRLTVDHIIPDRSRSQFTNLQLLCKKCHDEKGGNEPDKRDISPFSHEGEPCVHRITCTEVDYL